MITLVFYISLSFVLCPLYLVSCSLCLLPNHCPSAPYPCFLSIFTFFLLSFLFPLPLTLFIFLSSNVRCTLPCVISTSLCPFPTPCLFSSPCPFSLVLSPFPWFLLLSLILVLVSLHLFYSFLLLSPPSIIPCHLPCPLCHVSLFLFFLVLCPFPISFIDHCSLFSVILIYVLFPLSFVPLSFVFAHLSFSDFPFPFPIAFCLHAPMFFLSPFSWSQYPPLLSCSFTPVGCPLLL